MFAALSMTESISVCAVFPVLGSTTYAVLVVIIRVFRLFPRVRTCFLFFISDGGEVLFSADFEFSFTASVAYASSGVASSGLSLP